MYNSFENIIDSLCSEHGEIINIEIEDEWNTTYYFKDGFYKSFDERDYIPSHAW